MTISIGIAGAHGSFSEEAAKHYCRTRNIDSFDLKFLVSVENVLVSLAAGAIQKGIFPIENSNGGIVYEAVYAMARHTFSIEGFFEIDVRHCLLAYLGTKRENILTITSHDQAIKQCRMYLKRCFPLVTLQEYPDTAKAAADLGSGVLTQTTAVIAPKGCAELYTLEVLEEGIQDLKFNFTTFIAAVRAPESR